MATLRNGECIIILKSRLVKGQKSELLEYLTHILGVTKSDINLTIVGKRILVKAPNAQHLYKHNCPNCEGGFMPPPPPIPPGLPHDYLNGSRALANFDINFNNGLSTYFENFK